MQGASCQTVCHRPQHDLLALWLLLICTCTGFGALLVECCNVFGFVLGTAYTAWIVQAAWQDDAQLTLSCMR